jgi:hypothetical protein
LIHDGDRCYFWAHSEIDGLAGGEWRILSSASNPTERQRESKGSAMRSKLALAALSVAALCAFVQSATAAAYRTYVERTAAAGVPTHIWTFANCIGRTHYPFSRTAFVEHGTVTFKESTGTRCGLANVITREVWYTSAPGFVGVDRLTFPRGHGHAEIFAIIVH